MSRASSGFRLCSRMGEMMNWWTLAACRFGCPLRRQQAYLRVGPCPESQAVEPALRLAVLFQPDKGHRLVSKAPGPDEPQGLRELGEGGPQKKRTVRGGQFRHRELRIIR